MERSKFVLIGLTGRTGSGCTTAATILEDKNALPPEQKDINYNGSPFFEGLNERRYEILKNYYKSTNPNFLSIKVSDLISAYLLSLEIDEALDFIKSSQPGIDEAKLRSTLTLGAFSNNRISSHFKALTQKLINHSTNPELTTEEEKNFLRFLKLIRKFTSNFKKDLKEVNNNLYISTY
jgi:hypothetical protein